MARSVKVLTHFGYSEGCAGFHRGRDSSKVMVRSFLLDDKLFADPTTSAHRAIMNVSNDMGLPKL